MPEEPTIVAPAGRFLMMKAIPAEVSIHGVLDWLAELTDAATVPWTARAHDDEPGARGATA